MVVMALSLPAKKILVVDDDPVIQKALSWDLEHAGYEVLAAVDGPEAFAVVRRQRPDLILLDMFFPPDAFQSGNTWDAFLIIQWLQRMDAPRNRHIPIIVISGAEPAEFWHRCLTAGAVAYFQKPLRVPELLTAVRQATSAPLNDWTIGLPPVSNSDRLRPTGRPPSTRPSVP